MTTTENNQFEYGSTQKPERHRLRNFLFGVGTLFGGLVLLDAHEVKDPTAGIQVVGAGTGVIEDLTGKENIYLDWVDLGALAISTVGASIAINAATHRDDER